MERNIALLEQTMQYLQDHPGQHDQTEYFNTCGTPSCYAGWAIHLAGYNESDARCETVPAIFAAQLLGLTQEESDYMFAGANTREMLALMVKDLVNGDELRPYNDYVMESEI